jgi:hypothetical protein
MQRPRLLGWIGLAALLTACTDGRSGDSRVLTRHDSEAAGSHCTYGGSVVRAGHDRDGDGVLDDDEVEAIDYICDRDATREIARNDVEPPGANCLDGGTAVRTGIDRDADGVLDDNEIVATSYVCAESQIFDADFRRADWDDPKLVARLLGARVVTGRLEVAQDAPVALPLLELVIGDIDLSGGMPSIELPALRSVGGNASIDAPGLDVLELPVLASVGGEFHVIRNGVAGQMISAPVLVDVQGHVIFSLGTKGHIDMPRLEHVGGTLAFDGELADVAMDALKTVDGALIYDDSTMTAIELSKLKTVGGDFLVSHRPLLEHIRLPALEAVGKLHLSNLEALTTLSLPALQNVQDVDLRDLPALSTLDFTQLRLVSETFVLTGAPVLHTLSLPALLQVKPTTQVGDQLHSGFAVHENAGLETVDLPALYEVGGAFSVSKSPALTAVHVPALDTAYSIELREDPVLARLEAHAVGELDVLLLVDAPLLTDVDLGMLRAVGELFFRGVPLVDLSGFPNLERVGRITFYDLPELRDLRGSALADLSVARLGAVDIELCPKLRSFAGLDGVTEMQEWLWIQENTALVSLAGLDHLAHVDGFVLIFNTPVLADLNGLAQLRSVEGNLTIEFDNALTSLAGLDALGVVGGAIRLSNLAGVSAEEIAAFRQRLGH